MWFSESHKCGLSFLTKLPIFNGKHIKTYFHFVYNSFVKGIDYLDGEREEKERA